MGGEVISGFISGRSQAEMYGTNSRIMQINRLMAERKAALEKRLGEIQAGLSETLADERVSEISGSVKRQIETIQKVGSEQANVIERVTKAEEESIGRITAKEIANIEEGIKSQERRISGKIETEKGFISEAGQREIGKMRRETKKYIGQQRARLAAQGLMTAGASGEDIIMDVQSMSNADIVSVKNDITRRAFGVEDQGTNDIYMARMQGADKIGTMNLQNEKIKSELRLKGLEAGKIRMQTLRDVGDIESEGRMGTYQVKLGKLEDAFRIRSQAGISAMTSIMQGYAYGIESAGMEAQRAMTGIATTSRISDTLLTRGIQALSYSRKIT
jgi:hypothetical protein